MRINHKLLRHACIELAVTFRRLIQADDLHAQHFGNVDAGLHDRPHQLTVVLHVWGLAGVEALRLGPYQIC